MSRIVLDARTLTLYSPLSSPFHAATEMLLVRLATLLGKAGHDVHVLSIEKEEQVIANSNWWPVERGPRKCDVLIQFANQTDALHEFTFKSCYVFQTSPHLILQKGNWERVTGFVALSNTQSRLTLAARPQLGGANMLVIKPGVDMPQETLPKIPGRVLYCSSPDRGLIHLCHAWPKIKEAVPHATIRVTYLAQRWVEVNRWAQDIRGIYALELEEWFRDPSVVVGQSHNIVAEQLQAELHAMPMNPYNMGDGAHMLAGMECAAAGDALLYSTCEGLPEIFGQAADFLELPINEDDWAHHICDILLNEGRKAEMQQRAYQWALTQPWSRWEEQWLQLVEGTWSKQAAIESAPIAESVAGD